ncbi:TraU family protein [Rhodanobacter denitrificans]|uniref:TraU protein n=1 Tax=Rhodanobacter denitrificans TaxID=666685 RepID=M4NGA5_9GAMM|nr:TraU family protein [Rhodanobacter denitrificans]AGG89117.1 TraU protein [Rhodanobacter denitrificans]UJJ52941.1 TraU family protein [Rhodanobacter denitrificans]
MGSRLLSLFAGLALFATAGSAGAAASSGGDGGGQGHSHGPGMAALVSEQCPNCLYPITIAGAPIGNSAGVPAGAYRAPLCWCKHVMGIPIPGIPYGGWVPERLIETVRAPYDSPIFGGTLGGGSAATSAMLRGGSADDSTTAIEQGFSNMHVFRYPVGEIYGQMLAAACLSNTSGGADLAYVSEIDPSWSKDSLSLFLTPEAAVFATKPAQLACMADAAASNVYQPNDAMFWCMGSWGSSYPQNGATGPTDVPRQAAFTAAHAIAMLQRRLLINKTMGPDAICNAYPEPMLIKSMFKLEQLWPVPELTGDHWIGQDPNLWGEFRYRPYVGEDFVQLGWQFVNCCVY